MDKNKIDQEAECEASALSKQGRYYDVNSNRKRIERDYNKVMFDKLFKD